MKVSPKPWPASHTVVDVSNSPSFADDDVMHFFTTSTRNLLAAERAAGVQHHVALSIVGTDRVPESGYLRAKAAQEKLIDGIGCPVFHRAGDSVLRIRQRHRRFGNRRRHGAPVPRCGDPAHRCQGRRHRRHPRGNQRAAQRNHQYRRPDKFGMDDFIRIGLAAQGDPRQVVTDPTARYFGALLDDRSIVPLRR